MNQYQTQLFNDLEHLVKITESFYKQVAVFNGITYWIYNYRLVSSSQFDFPNARECRGHMFEMEEATNLPIRLASLPMHKFHNLNECESTQNLDLNLATAIESKFDGSLISTFYQDIGGVKTLCLKSKGSLNSSQAIDSMNWLKTQPDLYTFLHIITTQDITVNMEWISPSNRIVVRYQTPQLVILNARNNLTGEYVDLKKTIPTSVHWMPPPVDTCGKTLADFINESANERDIEGYVIKFNNGLWVKFKTIWYRELHKTRDSVNNNKALYACIVNEAADELRSLFYDDPYSLKRIQVAEEHVSRHYNHMVKTVEDFYELNRNLSRKDYAIKGQQDNPKHIFTLCMEKYIGRDVDYKAAMVKYYDIYPLPLANVEQLG